MRYGNYSRDQRPRFYGRSTKEVVVVKDISLRKGCAKKRKLYAALELSLSVTQGIDLIPLGCLQLIV